MNIEKHMKFGRSILVSVVMILGCNDTGGERVETADMSILSMELSVSEKPDLEWNLWPIDTSIRYITGQFDPAKDTVFTMVEQEFADRSGLYLRKDTYQAYKEMDSAAKTDGISLQIRSATRNFDAQKSIWEKKWLGKTPIENGERLNESTPDPVQRALKILRYSSMPGTSRHHWGTDIDLNNFTNQFFEHGEGLELYNWMEDHAAEYGFRQPYTAKDSLRPDGYNEERWHWSFYPVSDVLITYAVEHLKDSMITGFLGAETAVQINVVDKYILGINPSLLPENQ